MSEYIGSRISLVSKSEIRYEGTLVKIDSETATVSLQDVQCHGTEGRKNNASEEIPGSDSVYDGIVFRGSDVKDLTIVAPPKENRPPQQQMPNDPAILSQPESAQSHTQHQQPQQPQPPFRGPQPQYHQQQQQQQFGYSGPPPNQFQQHARFQGPGGAHGFPGQPGAVPGYGMGYGPPPPGYGMNMGYGPPPGHGFPGPFPPQQQPIGPPGQQMGPPPNGQQQRPPHQLPGQQQQAPIGSKQNTPQPTTSQAPPPATADQSKPAEVSELSTTPAPSSAKTPAGPPPPVESKPSTTAASAPPKPNQAQQPAVPKPVNKTGNRVAVPLGIGSPASRQQPKPAAPAQGQQATQAPLSASAVQPPQTKASATEAATAAVAAAMAKLGTTNRPSGGVDNLTQKVSQIRVDDGQARGRGRGRGGSGPRGGRRESTQKNVDVPKEDFDFETANAKFNKRELAKEAIASGSPLGSPTNEAFSSATNGHADDEEVVIPAKPSNEKGYDKKSSFFDNISSDLKDRTEQQQTSEFVDGRAMRREERSKNMETFGQGSVDGGFRGRGRGRGRGFGGRGRGYYGSGRGGFDGGDRGGFRGRGGRNQGAETSTAV